MPKKGSKRAVPKKTKKAKAGLDQAAIIFIETYKKQHRINNGLTIDEIRKLNSKLDKEASKLYDELVMEGYDEILNNVKDKTIYDQLVLNIHNRPKQNEIIYDKPTMNMFSKYDDELFKGKVMRQSDTDVKIKGNTYVIGTKNSDSIVIDRGASLEDYLDSLDSLVANIRYRLNNRSE